MSSLEFTQMTVIDEHAEADFRSIPGTSGSHVHQGAYGDFHLREGVHRKESGKRGRKPGRKSSEKIDMKAKLERSRQSARECRARKKLRYQYLEELVNDREQAVMALRKELDMYLRYAAEMDAGRFPEGLQKLLLDCGALKQE
ncbi:REPTOR-binding partner [Aethina tumida]|uniref:REPTOR-binding partner n=1 Tax=Aethina tumida TaxID=116153 RepID=UPI00096B34E2|nr:REPTOR-binding partner [Aethina tumida]